MPIHLAFPTLFQRERSPSIPHKSPKFRGLHPSFGAGRVHILHGSYCRSVKDLKVVPIQTTNIKQAIVILLWQRTH